ncbi:sequence-specific DNA binding transcription factor [Actinidia rufa]|uniref:Sequence-specific DNA binding transcription factor n=1 Tax=Actinidia rufa TaxID=165716 RepID=A0A7J0FW88_9ERIC|nr:sequence-specific DNA binding transcription factor [Actinidia rufa]
MRWILTNQTHLPSPPHTAPQRRLPRKPPPLAAGGSGGDRLKRDEWSEGAVSTLLEAYEAKWVLRNRAKLKGQDWEDVARHVSSRANETKSPKTQTQCKNKIESMKKRYRSESAAVSEASSWPLFPRLDLLLRGNAPPSPHPPVTNAPLMLIEPFLSPPPPPPPLPHGIAQNSHGSNGVDRGAKEDGVGMKLSDHESDKNPLMDTDSSTPALYGDKEKMKVVVRSEQARMDTMREVEKMRAEAEAKSWEIDLKRTEILANTQLEIARLIAGVGKGIDSSLRIGRS